MASASCPVRDLSSMRVVQSASWQSASCPVTSWYTAMVGTGHVHLFQFTRNVWLIAPRVCYCAQKRRRPEYDCVFTSGCNLQRWSWAWVVSNCCETFLSWIIMVAVWNRADHYIFILWFLPSIFLSSSFFSSPCFFIVLCVDAVLVFCSAGVSHSRDVDGDVRCRITMRWWRNP